MKKALVLSGLFMAHSALADSKVSIDRVYLVPSLAYHFLDNEGNIDDVGSLGLNVGYQLAPKWSAELGYRFGSSDTAFGDDADMASWEFDALYHLTPASYWQPYVLGTLVDLTFDVDKKRSETQVGMGVGSYYQLQGNIRLRGDVRALYTSSNNLLDEVVTLGVQFSFGGSDKPPQTPVTKVAITKAPVAPTPAPAPVPSPVDSDKDGIVDELDQCPNTIVGRSVNKDGCHHKLMETRTFTLDVNFESSSAELASRYHDKLQSLAVFLTKYSTSRVVIEGHTDSSGSAVLNQRLSEGRAESVMRVLIDAYGIDENRIEHRGFGASQPIADNSTIEGRRTNRRVHAVVEAHVDVE